MNLLAKQQFKILDDLHLIGDMAEPIDLSYYRQVGIVDYDQVIKKMQDNADLGPR